MSFGDIDPSQSLGGGTQARSAPAPQVTFSRRELDRILDLYGRKVAAGEWRDYAIDFLKDRAVFSVFRRACEVPIYRIEKHPKLDPVATMTEGVFIAGCVNGPKDIPTSVAQGAAASARVMGRIEQGEIALEPVRASVDADRCSGCRICNDLCPFNAITFLEERGVTEINPALCQGCGTCIAACPVGAISGTGFSNEQILAQIEGLLMVNLTHPAAAVAA